MSDPFIGEIRMFAGDFAPQGWARCDGQLMAISQNDALFSLFGTIYGGDGETTFGLPDLRGRVPIHYGSGPGLTPRNIGAKGGAETVAVSVATLPSHTHTLTVSTGSGTSADPSGEVLAASPNVRVYRPTNPATDPNVVAMESVAAAPDGGQSHNNLMPFQCVTFIVSLFGIFPSGG